MTETEKMPLTSHDVDGERVAQLRALFPEAWSEETLDVEKLAQLIGQNAAAQNAQPRTERYGLSWAGKAEAHRVVQNLSTGTLRPAPDESVNFETSGHLILEGDNLEVLKLLQKSYARRVKMIYIDPPYNTGNEFIYPDNFREGLQTYLEYSGQVRDGVRQSTNAETNGRYHSNWLNMMYPRLFLARNLLKDDGVIFVSIDDHEVHNLRLMMNEIFGEENFVAQFIWNTEGHTDNQFEVKANHEYVVLYARDWNKTSLGHVVDPNTRAESNLWQGFAENSITKNGPGNPPSEVTLPKSFPCTAETADLPPSDLTDDFYDVIKQQGYISRSVTKQFDVSYPIRKDPMTVRNSQLNEETHVFSGWANVNKLKEFIANDCQPITQEDGDSIRFFLSERGVIYYRKERAKARNILSVLRNLGTTERMRSELEDMGILFQYPKPKELLKYIVQLGEDKNGIVLDFFAGSGTTAQAVLELNNEDGGNRRFVLVQLPEPTGNIEYSNIAEITKERVRRVIAKMNESDKGKLPLDGDAAGQDRGFRVFKLDASNFKVWDGDMPQDGESLAAQLLLYADHRLPDRSAFDILFELLLKSGVPLSAPIEERNINGQTVYIVHTVSGDSLFLYLADDVDEATLAEVIALEPSQVLCLDAGFHGNDQLKNNIVLQMRDAAINFRTV